MLTTDVKRNLLDAGGHPHYVNRYIWFITKYGNLGQGERHHVLPKSIFPQYKNFRWNPWNKCVLSPRAHVIAHLILKKCGYKEMSDAYYLMNRNGRNRYEEHPRGMTGKTHTEEYKKMMVSLNSGMKNPMFGVKLKGKLGDENPMFGTRPWNHGKTRNSKDAMQSWIAADSYYILWSELQLKQTKTVGGYKLAEVLGVPATKTLRNMCQMFKDGWVPLEDPEFVEFRMTV